MERVKGKVAVITGAARGQGRSHAVRLAEEGADILAIDICKDIDIAEYPMATPEDLAETVKLVEKTGQRIIAETLDVRDRAAVDSAVGKAVEEFGKIDIVVPNAGILPLGDLPVEAFAEVVDVNLIGALNTVHSCLPHLGENASVIMVGSIAALMTAATDAAGPAGPGGAGYSIAKQTLASYTTALAMQLAGRKIRVNAVHPTNVDTHMINNAGVYKAFRPDLENPTKQDVEEAFRGYQAMPVAFLEPNDVSDAVVFLASDESKYITGVQLKVDAGALLRFGQ